MARRSLYWADAYVEKKLSAKEAIGRIRPGTRVFIGSSCGEPQHLVKALAEASNFFLDIEIMRLLTLETAPLSIIADDSSGRNLNIRSFYLGSAAAANISERRRFITPLNLSAIPRLFKSRGLPIHTALIQVSPPDDFGWMSLGVAVDITLAAAQSADWVIAQVNPRMPRVLGQSFIHVNDVDVVVEHEEELLTIGELPELDTADQIGRLVASLIEDGSTIDICLGATPHATLMALSEKNDLGIHSQYLTDGMMTLVSKGIITNRRKGFNDGQIVASSAVGTTNFYEFLDDNPSINFYPSDYVNNPGIIARHNRMVSINMAMAIDLTGQVAADALPYNHFSGVTGMVDFMRGAVASKGGKSILMMPSRHFATHQSRIVPQLQDMAVVVPRGDVHHVVTEYGAVNLFGKSLQERAMAMISIAHPDDREALFREAQRQGLLGPERTLRETLQGIYPVQLEEKIEVGGENRHHPAGQTGGRKKAPGTFLQPGGRGYHLAFFSSQEAFRPQRNGKNFRDRLRQKPERRGAGGRVRLRADYRGGGIPAGPLQQHDRGGLHGPARLPGQGDRPADHQEVGRSGAGKRHFRVRGLHRAGEQKDDQPLSQPALRGQKHLRGRLPGSHQPVRQPQEGLMPAGPALREEFQHADGTRIPATDGHP